jgi:hypothetical protein
MSNEARYFAVLAGAIGQIEEDSFEARGVVYDQLWKIVLEQLQADGNASGESIAKERAAFLNAVKRLEFGERLPPQPGGAAGAPAKPERPRGRSILRRVAWRTASASVVLAAIGFAYLVFVVDGEGAANSWQSQLRRVVHSFGDLVERQPVVAPRPVQRAVLYEESTGAATGATFSGQAVWRHARPPGTAGASAAVLSVDAEIPQKKLVVNISLRRAGDGGGAISHLVEFKFLNPDGSASDAVEDVLGILMKNEELSRGIELAGKVVRVQHGLFLMGLSGSDIDLGRNVKLLKERPWLDIPFVMKDRTRNILAIEKGPTGQSAVEQAFVSWGHG